MNDLLRQPQAAIEALQDERLRAMLALCARGHPYYRRVWSAAASTSGRFAALPISSACPLPPRAT